jgi:hypothetical protein
MIERTRIFGSTALGLIEYGSLAPYEEFYGVVTDEPYRLQKGDRTIEVRGDADIIFEDVRENGAGVWVIRDGVIYGYVYNSGKWEQVK